MIQYVFLITVMLVAFLVVACGESTPIAIEEDDHVIEVPGEQPTIQAGIDAAGSGDTVLVASGEYSGDGNRDLEFGGKSLILRSVAGPLFTTLNLQGDSSEPHTGFYFMSDEDSSTIVEGFTVRNGWTTSGGALECRSSSPEIRWCIFVGNEGEVSGGAVRCKDSSPHFINCTFVANRSPAGAAAFCLANSSPVFDNCILADNLGSSAILATDNGSQPRLSCCDLFANEGGNWTSIEEQEGSGGNFSLDPLFCELAADDFQLQEDSPCRATNNGCEVLIGATSDPCD
jgi:hypothetical protein